ncbi:MAG: TlpA family protein disulfide reductase [Bacteroidales bacterium]|nr:TlpA family protein disulfide reductase [Bacteroidales bacterium]MCF8456710.1 TlpA family protein disulfide reductase [Bacteroidales bacterium]
MLPTYSGSELVFETYTDYITHESYVLGKARVGVDGRFSLEINLKSTVTSFVKTGIYQGFFILEPGKSYDIQLPEKEEKTEREKLNPFFEEIRIYIQTRLSDSTELNYRHRQLSNKISDYVGRNVADISMGRIRKQKVDSFILATEQDFPAEKNTDFYIRRKYMIGNLKSTTYIRSVDVMAKQYFLNQPILYHNEDYMKLFNQVFDKFFVFFGRSKYGSGFHDKISEDKDLGTIRKQICLNPSFANDTLIDMLILRGLYDGYYLGKYELDVVLCLLDSLGQSAKVEEQRIIANNIRDKITRLAVSYTAPGFELFNKDSQLVRLEQFKGKYVYLNFCSHRSLASQEEFVLLNELHKQYKDKLAIVSISMDEKADEFYAFMKEKDYKWTCLSIQAQPDLMNLYQVRVIPAFYLIDPYSKILLAPALSPRENFENEFHRILNNRD